MDQPVWTLVLDANNRVVSTNEACRELVGLDPEKIVGKIADQVFPLDILSSFMAKGFCFLRQSVLFRMQAYSCDYMPIIENGQPVGGNLAVSSRNAKQRHSLELRDVLSSFDPLTGLGQGGMIVVDRESVIIAVDFVLADILATSQQNMLGKHVIKSYPNSKLSRLPTVMETCKAEIGDIHNFNGRDMVVSRYPLLKEGQVIGAFGKILFKDVNEVELMANRLKSIRNQVPTGGGGTVGNDCRYDIGSMVGNSKVMTGIKSRLLKVAERGSNVLLVGESGTGKELFAHAIHAASKLRHGPFVMVNCAAIPEHLLESELFGYTEGAFTGAKKGGQVGKFELAHGGTIFLDEVGDMSAGMQAKLLRILQEGELTPLGGGPSKLIDVRVVAATNVDLKKLVSDGVFRQDLFYRLNIVAFSIPPLRERVEDIGILVMHFIDHFNSEFGLAVEGLEPAAWEVLRNYTFPGNIRELRNSIECAFNTVTGTLLRRNDLPSYMLQDVGASFDHEESSVAVEREGLLGKKSLAEIVDAFEKGLVEAALLQTGGNRIDAARLLGISRPGLYKKIKKHQIR